MHEWNNIATDVGITTFSYLIKRYAVSHSRLDLSISKDLYRCWRFADSTADFSRVIGLHVVRKPCRSYHSSLPHLHPSLLLFLTCTGPLQCYKCEGLLSYRRLLWSRPSFFGQLEARPPLHATKWPSLGRIGPRPQVRPAPYSRKACWDVLFLAVHVRLQCVCEFVFLKWGLET